MGNSSLKENGNFVIRRRRVCRTGKNNGCLLPCHTFSPGCQIYIKKKKSILLFSWQHPMVPLLACFGFCEITLPILPFSALTHLHGSFFFPSFSSWYVVGHLDVSLYSYPYNFRKHITSGYCLYNDGSQI